MGMYTELALGVEFKSDLPPDVLSVLEYMNSASDDVTWQPPMSHPLFETAHWRWMLRSGGSYYFDAQPCRVWKYDDIPGAWFLTLWTNIKNYDGEWEAFLNFIAPHLKSSGYIGHYRYEEDENPTCLYAEDGKIIRRAVRAEKEGE